MQINSTFQKNANISMVASLLWKTPGLSRVDIARELVLYRSTVSNIINNLIDNGVVFEEKEGVSLPQGGRKPICLGINERFGCVLGMEIQPSSYNAVVLNMLGEVLYSISGDFPERSFNDVAFFIIDSILPKIEELQIPLLGICIGLPGIIDSSKGIIIRSDPFHLQDHVCASKLYKKYMVPVIIENDANCLAWLELANTRGKNKKNFLCVNAEFHYKETSFGARTGMGVGLGLALDGTVYTGTRFGAGEFISVSWREGREGQTGLSEEIMTTLQTNNNSFTIWVEDLFTSLVPLISLLDLEGVYAHGELSRRADFVNSIIAERVPQFKALLDRCGCEFTLGNGSEFSVAIGAAQMFFLQLFSLPLFSGRDPSSVLEWDTIFKLANKKKDELF